MPTERLACCMPTVACDLLYVWSQPLLQDCLVPGSLQCTLCAAGLTGVDAILGCRTTRGQREYYVKFKDASYRRVLGWLAFESDGRT